MGGFPYRIDEILSGLFQRRAPGQRAGNIIGPCDPPFFILHKLAWILIVQREDPILHWSSCNRAPAFSGSTT